VDFEAADCVKAMCLGPDERRKDVPTRETINLLNKEHGIVERAIEYN